MLMRESGFLFVRKIGNIERNLERLAILREKGYNVPEVYKVSGSYIDMQYIHGLDMRNYLVSKEPGDLSDFLIEQLKFFKAESTPKDYTETYYKKLDWLPSEPPGTFPFVWDELIYLLPKHLPQGLYHGDLTMENIISADERFFLIDPLTSEYDSYVFDIAKLMQDLDCKWFIRNNNAKIDTKLQCIKDDILGAFPVPGIQYLTILMLLRVYPYANDNDKKFLIKEIDRLWLCK